MPRLNAVWLCGIGLCLLQPGMQQPAQSQERKARGTTGNAQSKLSATEIYRDAAGYQNNKAYDIAIEEWQRLLREFPDDDLASSAQHYLGISYVHTNRLPEAVEAFQQALTDQGLKVRDETLINLGWCLFAIARAEQPDSPAQQDGFAKAKTRLSAFLKEYPQSEHVDQALFYLGEIAYTQGDSRSAIRYYEQLLKGERFQDSKLRADARYALAVAREEQGQQAQAQREFEQFLEDHGDHRLRSEVSIRLADLLLANEQYDEAAEQLESIAGEENSTMRDYALLRLGYALEKLDQGEKAVRTYQRLLADFPDSQHASVAAISVGQHLFRQGDWDGAIQQFRKALEAKDEQSADAAHWIATAMLRQGKAKEASRFVEDVLAWAGDNSTLQMDYADALYADPEQIAKAAAAYELIAEQSEEDTLAARAAYNAAFAALQMRDFEKARSWSEWFLQRHPQHPLRSDVAYVAAETLLQEGEHQAAAQAYRKLIAADAQHESVDLWFLRLAMALYLDGDYVQAIELLNDSMPRFTQARQIAEAQFILGASLLYEEQISEAIKQLSASHRTDDDWSSADEVLLLLAEAHQRNQDNQAAQKTLESILKKYPTSRLKPQVEYKLGQLSAAMEDFDDAISRYRSIVSDPEAASFHDFASYGIAWCLMQQDNYAAALDILQQLLEEDPRGTSLAEAQLAAGVCLRKLGRPQESAEQLERFLATRPTGVSLGNGLYELGLANVDLGQVKDANRSFSRLLQEVPDYPSADKVLYELAWNYEEAGDREASNRYFQQLSAEHAASEFAAEARYMLAQRSYDNEEYERAAQIYKSVLKATQDPELLEKAYYKIGWSLYQQQDYAQAAANFARQYDEYPNGSLAVDSLFMQAECAFKQNDFERALAGFRQARRQLESSPADSGASEQVQALIYLHGAQCLRELKQWKDCESWLDVIVQRYPQSIYISTVLYELGFCKQKQDQPEKALELYAEVARNYKTEVGARARFMMGEVYFSQRDFAKAIPEFQRVMYGFGGDKAPPEIRNWQVKSAFEAARCSEVLIENLRGNARDKVIEAAQEYYGYIVNKHAAHDLAAQAETRLGELQKLR